MIERKPKRLQSDHLAVRATGSYQVPYQLKIIILINFFMDFILNKI